MNPLLTTIRQVLITLYHRWLFKISQPNIHSEGIYK